MPVAGRRFMAEWNTDRSTGVSPHNAFCCVALQHERWKLQALQLTASTGSRLGKTLEAGKPTVAPSQR